MPNIYITDETKNLLEKVSETDKRTQDGEINYLLSKRSKELGIVPELPPSVKSSQSNNSDNTSQVNS